MKKFCLTMGLLGALLCKVDAQVVSRSLPILEINTDVRTAGMGNANMGFTRSALYEHPTVSLFNDNRFEVSTMVGIYPKEDVGRLLIMAGQCNVKIGERHLIMAGGRDLRGYAIPRVDESGLEGTAIRPYEQSADLGYAYKIGNTLAVFVRGSLYRMHHAQTATTFGISAGVSYSGQFALQGRQSNYMFQLAANNWGGKLKYAGQQSSYALPSSIELGGEVCLPFADNHEISAAVASRYFALPADASTFVVGAGLEYKLFQCAAIRTGYEMGNGNNAFTLGAGAGFRGLHLDVAYELSENRAFNLLRIGLSVAF